MRLIISFLSSKQWELGSSHQNGADGGFACDNFKNYFLVKLFLVKVMYYGVLNYKIKNKPNLGAIF